ncbi:hypothetical protein HOD38_05970 [archaeon]|jgi:RNase P/RNase MRP subunit p30|nr:hypothetical protein [archaeon]MBT4397785.1 hypothetical protein [archaeon]MBT4441119.1 hypothetical protein [archaeon]
MDINLFDKNIELVVKSAKDRFVIIKGGSDKVNRLAVSSKKVDILLDSHLGYRKDKMHQRDSGLNQVLCKLAKENNVAIGFSFSSILHSKNYRDLGRIIQSIKLCRKYKVKIVVGNFAKNKSDVREIKDVYSMFKVLGMTGMEIKASSEFIEGRLDYKKRYVSKGVRKI